MLSLQKSPNRWSCLPVAFCNLHNIPIEKMMEHIGHLGSQHLFLEPTPWRSFHPQEIIQVMLRNYGIKVAWFEPLIKIHGLIESDPKFWSLFDSYDGVITGVMRGVRHAVVWKNGQIHDLGFTDLRREDISVECFFV